MLITKKAKKACSKDYNRNLKRLQYISIYMPLGKGQTIKLQISGGQELKTLTDDRRIGEEQDFQNKIILYGIIRWILITIEKL